MIMADRMRTVTHPLLVGEYKVDNEETTKLVRFNDNVVGAYTGDASFWHEVVNEAKETITPTDSFRAVRQKIERVYQRKFTYLVGVQVLVPLGYADHADYNTRGQQELDEARIASIDHQLKTTLAPGELVLVGKEPAGYEVYGLQDPGHFKVNTYGHAVAGSGLWEAQRPVVDNHRKSMSRKEAQELLFLAKKEAERDPHVGKLHIYIHLPEGVVYNNEQKAIQESH